MQDIIDKLQLLLYGGASRLRLWKYSKTRKENLNYIVKFANDEKHWH
jgi:hypothetical protein